MMNQQAAAVVSCVIVMLIGFGLNEAGVPHKIISGSMAGTAVFVIAAGAIYPSTSSKHTKAALVEMGAWVYTGMIAMTGILFAFGISAHFMLGVISGIGFGFTLTGLMSK